jgi:hypothetical protein
MEFRDLLNETVDNTKESRIEAIRHNIASYKKQIAKLKLDPLHTIKYKMTIKNLRTKLKQSREDIKRIKSGR